MVEEVVVGERYFDLLVIFLQRRMGHHWSVVFQTLVLL